MESPIDRDREQDDPEEERDEIGYREVDEEGEYDERGSQALGPDEPPQDENEPE
jgi:hypothetical protein